MSIQVKHYSGNGDPPASEALVEAIAPLVDGVRDEIRELRDEIQSLRTRRDPDRLVDLDEAADLLGVSRRTVDTLVHAGEIMSLKVRRCRRIPRKAIDAYIRRRVEEGGAQ